MEYTPLMLLGAGIGLSGSIISALSKEGLNIDWGFSPISIKNGVKVSILSAVSGVLVATGYDKFMEWSKTR